METNRSKASRKKTILNCKRPAFRIILVAILLGIVVAVCFLTVPKKNKTETEPEATPVPVFAGQVTEWLDYYSASDQMPWEETKEIAVDAFPTVRFRWTSGSVEAIRPLSGIGRTTTLFSGMPIWNVFFTDVTGDGKPELCASVSFGSGIVDEHVVVYDYANRQSYTLWDRGTFEYHLSTVDGALTVHKMLYNNSSMPVLDTGTLVMQDGLLCCRWLSDGSFVSLNRELHESELLGEWLVEEERDGDDNVLYTSGLDLWKEYHFKEDGTVTYNETVPTSSNYELAFGHPDEYRFAVYDNTVYIEDGRSCSGYYDAQTQTLQLYYQTSPGQYVCAKLRRMDDAS